MKMEKLLHKVFHKAQFDITIRDRLGNPIHPKEWFLVPLSVIDEAVERLKDNSLIYYQYEPSKGALERISI